MAVTGDGVSERVWNYLAPSGDKKVRTSCSDYFECIFSFSSKDKKI
jgi:hypothetical protein